jgi:hypothetical protein
MYSSTSIHPRSQTAFQRANLFLGRLVLFGMLLLLLVGGTLTLAPEGAIQGTCASVPALESVCELRDQTAVAGLREQMAGEARAAQEAVQLTDGKRLGEGQQPAFDQVNQALESTR